MSDSGAAPSARLAEAFAYALRLHSGQLRKRLPEDPTPEVPYLAHLMAVAALVLEHGGDEDEAIAALLHDGPEDQGGQATLDEIRRRFGERVAAIVGDCTDTLESPKPPWLERKRAYLTRLPEASESALLVSLADKVHNTRAIRAARRQLGERVWERFNADREGVIWYYRSLLELYDKLAPERCRPLVARLRRNVRALETGDKARAVHPSGT